MKRLFREAGIPTARFNILRKGDYSEQDISHAVKDLKLPIFVKPANLGSSVGISKAENRKELKAAIRLAFQFDKKIILEEAIKGREIECSVLGNESPIASIPGEIVLRDGFYSYDAKYVDADAAVPVPAADLSAGEMKAIQSLAIKVFKTLCCEGMGRVDFFLTRGGKIFANEINTLPGFTSVSMYPKMFDNSGVSYVKLLDKLIQFAIDRQKRESAIKRSV
jgi:D-alanine-D-alanine ligase